MRSGPHLCLTVHRGRRCQFSGPGELSSLLLHAGVTAPHRRGLRRQEVVGRLCHSGANSVEPLLTGGLAQDGLLVIVDLIQTYPAGVHGLRGGEARSVWVRHLLHAARTSSSTTAAAPAAPPGLQGRQVHGGAGLRRVLQGVLTRVNDAVELIHSVGLTAFWTTWRTSALKLWVQGPVRTQRLH